MTAADLLPGEYGAFYQGYVDLAGDQDLIEGLRSSKSRMLDLMKSIPESKHNYAYAAGKWTIKQILGHLIDTERVFAYRALRFARHDRTDLPGFDQDDYVPASKAEVRNWEDLLDEFAWVRDATLSLYKSFDEDMLRFIGTANNNPTSARALGFIIVGHETHHAGIINERYL